jgi:hypothetical protein
MIHNKEMTGHETASWNTVCMHTLWLHCANIQYDECVPHDLRAQTTCPVREVCVAPSRMSDMWRQLGGVCLAGKGSILATPDMPRGLVKVVSGMASTTTCCAGPTCLCLPPRLRCAPRPQPSRFCAHASYPSETEPTRKSGWYEADEES